MTVDRLEYLIKQNQKGHASVEEKSDFMFFLYKKGSINKEQYRAFMRGDTTDRFLKLALILGAAELFGYGIKELTGN